MSVIIIRALLVAMPVGCQHKTHDLKYLNYLAEEWYTGQFFTLSYTLEDCFFYWQGDLSWYLAICRDRQTIEGLLYPIYMLPWCYRSVMIKITLKNTLFSSSYQPVSHDTPHILCGGRVFTSWIAGWFLCGHMSYEYNCYYHNYQMAEVSVSYSELY